MDWAQILVYLLAVLFSIFLVLAIMLTVVLLQVTRQIKSAAESAEKTLHSLENSVSTFNRTAVPLMMTKSVIAQVMKYAQKDKKSKDE